VHYHPKSSLAPRSRDEASDFSCSIQNLYVKQQGRRPDSWANLSPKLPGVKWIVWYFTENGASTLGRYEGRDDL
jgi:hypothetical protein